MTQGNQSFPDSNAADTAELTSSDLVLTASDRRWMVALLNELAVKAMTVRELLAESVAHDGGRLVESAAARMVGYIGALADDCLGALRAERTGGDVIDWLASKSLLAAMPNTKRDSA